MKPKETDAPYEYISNKGVPKAFVSRVLTYIGATLAVIVVLFPYSLVLIVGALVIRFVNKLRSRIRISAWTKKYTHEVASPDNLRPIELGVLYDRQIMPNDLISLLFYLISVDVITLTSSQSDGEYKTVLQRNASHSHSLKKYEELFIEKLFGSETQVIWDARNNIFTSSLLLDLSFEVYKELQGKDYIFLDDNLENMTTREFVEITTKKLTYVEFIRPFLGITPKAITMLPRGTEIEPMLYGFRYYLLKAQKDRDEFHTQPGSRKLFVSTYFPYSVALGVSDNWKQVLYKNTIEIE